MDQGLPTTAYAVLGILSVNDEELTPGEIKLRSEFAFRHFYWSPAVSHIRRELRRLLQMGLVAEREIPIGQVRRSQVYRTTQEGERALVRWVSDGPPEEPVVVKDLVLLRVLFGDKAPRQTILSMIDARLDQVADAIREAQWGRRRGAELGLNQEVSLRFPMAVSEYKLRSLYFEQANLRQLRDTIVGFDAEAFKQDDRRKRGPLRRRHRDQPSAPDPDDRGQLPRSCSHRAPGCRAAGRAGRAAMCTCIVASQRVPRHRIPGTPGHSSPTIPRARPATMIMGDWCQI
jgi:DNA-binding PadR family transcriptional regulator